MLNYITKELERNASILKTMLENKTKEEYLWKVDETKWCLLEIIGHLVDEETLDFRTRLKSVLETPGQVPPSIQPEAWIVEHKYLDQNYDAQLNRFLEERAASIKYLKSLENPPLGNSYEHVNLGPLNGHLFLKNWLAHDHLHIKQIIRLNYEYLAYQSEVPINYAGKWT